MEKRRSGVLFGCICMALIITLLPHAASSAESTPKEKTTIHILTNPLGATGYVFGFALADYINKSSTWLKASAVETKASGINFKMVADDPAKRKNTLMYGSEFTRVSAEMAEPPFSKPYTGARWVGKVIVSAEPFVSHDPSTKKMSDLVGKHLGLGPKAGSNDLSSRAVLKAYGIHDKVKISNLTFGALKTAFLDGTVDVAWIACVDIGSGKWAPNPAGQEILASPKRVYFIGVDRAKIDEARQATGYPMAARVMSPGSIASEKPPEEVLALGVALGWWADVEMDEDVVYEISRVLWENANNFRNHHASGFGLDQENIHMVPGITEKDMHPGALKFAKEKGLKIGK